MIIQIFAASVSRIKQSRRNLNLQPLRQFLFLELEQNPPQVFRFQFHSRIRYSKFKYHNHRMTFSIECLGQFPLTPQFFTTNVCVKMSVVSCFPSNRSVGDFILNSVVGGTMPPRRALIICGKQIYAVECGQYRVIGTRMEQNVINK